MDDFEARRKMNDLKKEVGQEYRKTRIPPIKKKPPWQLVFRIIKVIVLLILLFASFLLGRISMHPKIVSYLPSTSVPTPTLDASPEEIVFSYFDAVKHRNIDQALTLFSPESLKKNGDYIIGETQDIVQMYLLLQEINILDIDETANVLVTLILQDDSETGEFSLKKHDGQWRIQEMNF